MERGGPGEAKTETWRWDGSTEGGDMKRGISERDAKAHERVQRVIVQIIEVRERG